jgi:N-dimethylarginine dimethylaminohydrolase
LKEKYFFIEFQTVYLQKTTAMNLNIKDEVSTLKAVVLGQPGSLGPVPEIQQAFDAKSYETILKGVYPAEEAVYKEMSAFEKVLLRYNVQVFRPWTLENCNQVFARDVAIVIDDKIINSNIIPDREDEKEAYEVIYDQIAYNKIFNLPVKAHVEGGDVVLMNDYVFVGLYTGADYPQLKTARTNQYAFDFLKELFPSKTFIPLELCKHDTDPRKGVLHLDCTFMPVGKNKAIVYRDGFARAEDHRLLLDIFGKENVFEINTEEMYNMNSNIFSISPEVVVSEQHFERLNRHLEQEWGLTVEKVPYSEISKMGGLLRCSTLPLIRE